MSHATEDPSAQRTRVYQSAYLLGGEGSDANPLVVYHQISISLPVSQSYDSFEAQLVLDPNVCTLNPFGDREGCTRMATRLLEVTVTRMRLGDPAKLERLFFSMTAKELPEHAALIAWPGGERIDVVVDSMVVPLFAREER